MKILRCDSSHDTEWNDFVQRSSGASFYHRAEWRRINEDCFGHQTAYLAAIEGDRFVGILPLVRLKSVIFGTIGSSLPFVNYGGPAADSPEIETALIKAAASIGDEWRVDYVELRCRHKLMVDYPSAEHKVSLTVDLGPDPDALFNAFAGDHRREIRRGLKNGYVVRFGGAELVDDFHALMSQTWRDMGTPIFAKDYVRAIATAFPHAIRICVIYDESGRPAATAFDGLQQQTVEGMWLGIGGEHRKRGVGYVLYWELIKHACQHGYARHHLGRSSVNSGAEQFKKKWNARSTQLYWYYVLRTRRDIPQMNVNNPKYQLVIAAWRRLPVGLTKRLGPMISRSIP